MVAEKHRRAAERHHVFVIKAEVLEFVRLARGQRQLFALGPKCDGKIVATRINDCRRRISSTTIARPSEETCAQPYQHVRIFQDVFSRKLWAVAMRKKELETVWQAFEHIVWPGGVPRRLDTAVASSS